AQAARTASVTAPAQSAPTAGGPALARSSRFGADRNQARVAQNSRSTAAARAGSWSIHQWPSPSRAAVLAPARAAALVDEAALMKGSSLEMITSPGAGMAVKS